MTNNNPLSIAQEIMTAFAHRTGLSSSGGKQPKRYLWTDAFAVCNCLFLYETTGEDRYRDWALKLIAQVHEVLGRHRPDDPRSGWISGLNDQEGERNPTCGGLRIGKPLNERPPMEAMDEKEEWDRDGQYYHYLTKWMHALDRTGRMTGKARYHRWATDLARTAHKGFTYRPASGGLTHMYWKMSIDLSRPLVTSMGQNDPLDGLITYHQLHAHASVPRAEADLSGEIADMTRVCAGKSWATDDPLGIGHLLWDAYKVALLIAANRFPETTLLDRMLESALEGLATYDRQGPWDLPHGYRLAFRELGLAIGLRAAEKIGNLVAEKPHLLTTCSFPERSVAALNRYLPLVERIQGVWLSPSARGDVSWHRHRDINEVMLATCLIPDGFLAL